FKLSILQLAIVFVGAIVFVIAVSGSDWWFGAGFYGSAIGGILAAICLSSVRKSYAGTVAAPSIYLPGAMQSFPQGQPQPYPSSYPVPQQHPTSYPQQQEDLTYGLRIAAQPIGQPPAPAMPQ